MLTQYTAYDDIRAALGVAPEEITDSVLALPNYELILEFDLEELGTFSPTFRDQFLLLIDTVATPTPSVNESRFVSILRVYAAYVIAKHLLYSMEMFAPVTIKDAKTEMVRTTDPYKDTRAGVENFYQVMRARLLAAYLVLFPTDALTNRVPTVPMIAVGLAADPVLGV